MPIDPPPWAIQLFASGRTGHLATAGAQGAPHVVPVCFVFLEGLIYTPIDEKPKTGRLLGRLRNLSENGRSALVVDRYDEDWNQLAWVMARGATRVVLPSEHGHSAAVAALRDKYPQYRLMALDRGACIEIRAERWSWWRWT